MDKKNNSTPTDSNNKIAKSPYPSRIGDFIRISSTKEMGKSLEDIDKKLFKPIPPSIPIPLAPPPEEVVREEIQKHVTPALNEGNQIKKEHKAIAKEALGIAEKASTIADETKNKIQNIQNSMDLQQQESIKAFEWNKKWTRLAVIFGAIGAIGTISSFLKFIWSVLLWPLWRWISGN